MPFVGNFAPCFNAFSRKAVPDLGDITFETITVSGHGFNLTHPAQDLHFTRTMIDEHMNGAFSFNRNLKI